MNVKGIGAAFSVGVGDYGGLPLDTNLQENWTWEDLYGEEHNLRANLRAEFTTLPYAQFISYGLVEVPRNSLQSAKGI